MSIEPYHGVFFNPSRYANMLISRWIGTVKTSIIIVMTMVGGLTGAAINNAIRAKSIWSIIGRGAPGSKLSLLFRKEPARSPIIAPSESIKPNRTLPFGKPAFGAL